MISQWENLFNIQHTFTYKGITSYLEFLFSPVFISVLRKGDFNYFLLVCIPNWTLESPRTGIGLYLSLYPRTQGKGVHSGNSLDVAERMNEQCMMGRNRARTLGITCSWSWTKLFYWWGILSNILQVWPGNHLPPPFPLKAAGFK